MSDLSINSMESLNGTIKSLKKLRSTVSVFFSELSEGVHLDENDDHKEKSYLVKVQKSLTDITHMYREFEQLCTTLNIPPTPLYLGNSGYLGQDEGSDRVALYSQLVESYKWTDKVHEYSGQAYTLLTQNALKRSNLNTGMGMKRRRAQPSSHNVPVGLVNSVIETVNKMFPDMKLSICRPYGANAIVQITLGRILKVLLVFKGLMIEWVIVKGYDEELTKEDGSIDLWTPSRYKVFRKVTDNTNAAMLHFYSPLIPELAVRSFMTWFHSFITLFTDVCKKCNRHLYRDMPPTWREFRTLDPYHEDCKPSW